MIGKAQAEAQEVQADADDSALQPEGRKGAKNSCREGSWHSEARSPSARMLHLSFAAVAADDMLDDQGLANGTAEDGVVA